MCDDYDTCSYYDEATGLVCIDELDECFAPMEALELYFEHEDEHELYWQIEDQMIWQMREEMENLDMHVGTEGQWMHMFYPVFEQ